MIAELLVPFVVLIFVSVPIAFSQGLASLTLMGLEDVLSGESFVKGITAGMNSFTLAAVPLFTFAGDIMGKGGISRRLLDLGRVAFDKITGGLGIVAIVACMFFAAISGTGSATVAAIGLIMIPVMTAAGYDKPYSASLVATAGTIGTIIPPQCLYGGVRCRGKRICYVSVYCRLSCWYHYWCCAVPLCLLFLQAAGLPSCGSSPLHCQGSLAHLC